MTHDDSNIKFPNLHEKAVKNFLNYFQIMLILNGYVNGLFFVALAIPLTATLLNFSKVSNLLMLLLGAFCAILVIYLSMHETRCYKKKLWAFLLLTTISVAFWALYSIAPGALAIFIARNVDRHFLGFVIPAATYYALNPFFIVVLGPLLTIIWMLINQRGYKVATPAKFAIGVLSMGLGYLVLVLAIAFHGTEGQISSAWIVLSYFLQTFGELFVEPIGFAMVGELVPPRLEGLMMGIWQLATGVGGALSQFMANMTIAPKSSSGALLTDPIYSHAFLLFGVITVIVGLIAVGLVPYLNRIIREANLAKLNPAAET